MIKRDRLVDRIGNFTTIPNSVIQRARKLGSHALTLFVYLRYRTNQKSGVAFPSYQTIRDDTGLSRATIAKAIGKLEDENFLTKRKRFNKSTIYTLQSSNSSSSKSELLESGSSKSKLLAVQKVNSNKIDLTRSREGNSPTRHTPKAKGKTSRPMRPTPLMQLLEKLTQQNIDWGEKKNGSILRQLNAVGATPEDVTRFSGWWANDWRGRKGDIPTLREVWKDWRKATQPQEREWAAIYER